MKTTMDDFSDLIEFVAQGNVNFLSKVLNSPLLKTLSSFRKNVLLLDLLNECKKSREGDDIVLRTVLKAWCDPLKTTDTDIVQMLSLNFFIPVDLLAYTINILCFTDYTTVVQQLFDSSEKKKDTSFITASARLQRVNPDKFNDIAFWNLLLIQFSNYENDEEQSIVVSHIKKRIDELQPYAKEPDWLKSEPLYVSSNSSKVVKHANDTITDVLETLTSTSLSIIPEAKKMIEAMVETTSLTLLTEIDAAVNLETISDDEKIIDPDMTEGPSNMKKNKHGCNQKNVCRMFTCLCLHEDEDDEDYFTSLQEWFKGRCEHCRMKIRTYRHALRYPVEEGSWYGCFCSFDCMEKSQPVTDMEKIKIENIRHIIERKGILEDCII